MRTAASLRLLLVPAALLAAGCDDSSSPLEPTGIQDELPAAAGASGPQENLAYWAEGYLSLANATAASSVPDAGYSYNRSGGAMTVTRAAGTTGRYVAQFSGLSGLLGNKSTVHVSTVGDDASYCKPVEGSLASDKVEVRCYRIGSGVPVNARFTLMVSGRSDNRAFAHANKPAASDYRPAAAGSWNPTGTTQVFRDGLGRYRVVFNAIGTLLTSNGGHVQVNATGTDQAHCKVVEWTGSPDLEVQVACFTPTGFPTDAKFTALATPPAAHLAYAWANIPYASSYTPSAFYSWNPVGGAITVNRLGVGYYWIRWTGTDAEIRDVGGIQVTPWGEAPVQCTLSWLPEGAAVKCWNRYGQPTDAWYGVMVHS